jgi:hypothetical protein
MNEVTHRIPSLDGRRAISLCMMLAKHLVGTQNFL